MGNDDSTNITDDPVPEMLANVLAGFDKLLAFEAWVDARDAADSRRQEDCG